GHIIVLANKYSLCSSREGQLPDEKSTMAEEQATSLTCSVWYRCYVVIRDYGQLTSPIQEITKSESTIRR
ncbi:hypothetical protein J6590_016663, partial [Homalodisca vitripennis]